MADNATVAIFDKDGNLGDVPYDQMKAALAAGGKPAVTITDPNGNPGHVPADRLLDAVKLGAKVVPLAEQENQHPGFWKTLGEDLSGLLHPSAVSPYPGMDTEAKQQLLQQGQADDAARKAEGQGHFARFANALGQAAGVNERGMAQSAKEGDVAGVLGHAAVPAVILGASEFAKHGPGLISDAAASRPGKTVGVVAKAVSKLPVIDKVVKAGKTLGELKDVWSDQPPPSEPDATSPKQNYAGENYGPMDKPKVGGEPDATASNKPYAGEERIKPKTNRDATGENKPYAGEKIVENDATPQNKDYAGEDWANSPVSEAMAKAPRGKLSELKVVNGKIVDTADPLQSLIEKGLSAKPTAISEVATPDVDGAAFAQALKENGGKLSSGVGERAVQIKKSWAAQSPKAQASIPTPATVEPSPSSEAYQEAPTPEGTRVPGENEDLTNLLTKSVEKAKAPEYDEATIAEARRQLTEQGYDPDHIELALQSFTGKAAPEPTVAPRARVEQQMGMSVDEQFRNHPAGPQPPFPQAAYEKALAGSDAIKTKLSSLKGVKVPRSADLTPEEIGALMRKFHGMRTQF